MHLRDGTRDLARMDNSIVGIFQEDLVALRHLKTSALLCSALQGCGLVEFACANSKEKEKLKYIQHIARCRRING
jgi:hypothetical protein